MNKFFIFSVVFLLQTSPASAELTVGIHWTCVAHGITHDYNSDVVWSEAFDTELEARANALNSCSQLMKHCVIESCSSYETTGRSPL